MRLEEIDLTKKSFSKGAFREGLENTSDHPDINTKDFYLCKISKRYYAGQFIRQWFGLSFDAGWKGLQYDKPGHNSSNWENIWKIIDE